MICCDSKDTCNIDCENWYHAKCIGMTDEEMSRSMKIDWYCHDCRDTRETKSKKRSQ